MNDINSDISTLNRTLKSLRNGLNEIESNSKDKTQELSTEFEQLSENYNTLHYLFNATVTNWTTLLEQLRVYEDKIEKLKNNRSISRTFLLSQEGILMFREKCETCKKYLIFVKKKLN